MRQDKNFGSPKPLSSIGLFGHSEKLEDQERSVALARRLGQPALSHAEGRYSIVQRFGCFPHRNPILGRRMTEEEQRFLDEGVYAG